MSRLCSKCAIVRAHARVREGCITLIDARAFTQVVETAKGRMLEGDGSDPGRRERAGGRECGDRSRLARLWRPGGRRLVLTEIRSRSADDAPLVARGPAAMCEALRREWAPVFARPPMDAGATATILWTHAV